ncbi:MULTISPECIES: pantoate--beta-alanine ligase [Saccharopolyspora]|uniref:Pantothenate synthetase n=1 Tax=Saccharopolyspora gregorii TaxID=33914 RepID=A0ABP6RYY9_9PSEU|nr:MULTISPECIES: pantoate--beta-alanine ligase [Saccharopolyspora]MCA1188604.1 pantoate--beta-alanine ligase [Saccharopolyspora sp. 6T]MCA1193192.1 pantoate--beta-alanine ligase [Saccharopolyspora sp. 6V]MCA1229917.1 pantoate--beta-alanine ligase [Saccharopolyspora sp. 6M]
MTTADGVGAGPGYTARELTVHRRPAELAKVTRALRSTGRPITLVPTMGALHEGHLELIRAARKVPAAVTVVSIFVNPLQFGAGEDLDRYPRTFDADLELCRAEGVELVLAPEPADMYAPDRQVGLTAGPLGEQLEGASRPGHFDGMLTVVAKLLGIVRPDLALFGEKDYQQLVLVRRMARDLNLDAKIQGVPIVRQADGLALSSRNAYLDAEQRRAALALSAAMAAGVHAGRSGPEAVLAAARAALDSEPLVAVDYLELRDTELGPAPASGEARLLVAAQVGGTRLIDNALVQLGPVE